MGDYLRSLGVNLVALPYFKPTEPVCEEKHYLEERHGAAFPYSGNVSFHAINQQMDQEIRQKYTKKPTPAIVVNWLMLLLAFWWTFFGLILWLVMLCLSSRPKKIAGGLMARRAFEMEMTRRLSQPIPQGREVDVGAHHVVLQFLERYTKILFLGSPLQSPPEFGNMLSLQKFAEDACTSTFQAYGWRHDEKLKPAVVQKAVSMLSMPTWGIRSLLNAVPACILLALMALNVLAAFFYSFAYFLVLLVIFAVIAALLFFTLFNYIMVTRIVEGVTIPAEKRIAHGAGADAVANVTDLGVCTVNTSINIPDLGGVVGSQLYWGKVGAGTPTPTMASQPGIPGTNIVGSNMAYGTTTSPTVTWGAPTPPAPPPAGAVPPLLPQVPPAAPGAPSATPYAPPATEPAPPTATTPPGVPVVSTAPVATSTAPSAPTG